MTPLVFSLYKVEYEGNEEEKKLLMSIVEPSAKTLIEKSKNGMVLIEKLKELFSPSGILTEARVLICFGDETKFSPSDLTGSPPKARLTEESLKQQELLMGEKDGVILEKLRVLTENKEHVEESYKSLFGEEYIGGKKAKFLYNKVKNELLLHPEKKLSKKLFLSLKLLKKLVH